MEIHRFYEPKSFLLRIQPFLDRNPGKYNLIRGILNALVTTDRYKNYYQFSISNEGRVIGAAIWTPPHPLQLTDLSDAAIAPLIRAISECEDKPTAFGGPIPGIDRFVAAWTRAQHETETGRWNQGVYQLEKVQDLDPTQGCLRYAAHTDVKLLTAWNLRFQEEAMEEISEEQARRSAERALKLRSAFFWTVEGKRVAMAGASPCPPYGRRIGPVYTPPDERGKGYATALVWTLSKALLEAGNQYCFLYTDLANKTANGIYQRIGYEKIGEAAHIQISAEKSA